eukprot:1098031-Prorocentrum_minimum.AAC.2
MHHASYAASACSALYIIVSRRLNWTTQTHPSTAQSKEPERRNIVKSPIVKHTSPKAGCSSHNQPTITKTPPKSTYELVLRQEESVAAQQKTISRNKRTVLEQLLRCTSHARAVGSLEEANTVIVPEVRKRIEHWEGGVVNIRCNCKSCEGNCKPIVNSWKSHAGSSRQSLHPLCGMSNLARCWWVWEWKQAVSEECKTEQQEALRERMALDYQMDGIKNDEVARLQSENFRTTAMVEAIARASIAASCTST